ncbi:MAG: Sua5/YciO/YrdC/YwlC family protein [Planctomycetota bacterium]
MPDPAHPAAVMPTASPDDAAETLNRGGLVGLPTETVYGVAARADLPGAMARLRELKQVGPDERFALHLSNADAALAALPAPSRWLERLLRKALPGPVTFEVHPSDGGPPVTLRCPDHPLTQRLLRAAAGPVVAASATPRGARPALDADAAALALGPAADAVLDGGRCRFGRPSTLVQLKPLGDGSTTVHQSASPDGRYHVTVVRSGVIDERMLRNMQTTHLLFVCTGNTCRSPMAEAVAKKRLEGKPDVRVGSAGVYAGEGQSASAEAVDAMRELGIDLSGHRSRPLSNDLIRAADRIFTMTESHRQAVLAQAPHAADKVVRLDEDRDIDDPYGAGPDVYRRTARQIETALEQRLTEQLS